MMMNDSDKKMKFNDFMKHVRDMRLLEAVRFLSTNIWHLTRNIICFDTMPWKKRTSLEMLLELIFALLLISFVIGLCLLPFIGIALGIITFFAWFATWVSINATNIFSVLVVIIAIFIFLRNYKRNIVPETQSADPNLIWESLALNVVIPVFKQKWHSHITIELLYYTGGANSGKGYYFELLEPCLDIHEQKVLQRKIIRKFCETNHRPFKEILNSNMIIVTAEYVFFDIAL